MITRERRTSERTILRAVVTMALVLACAPPAPAAATIDATLKVGKGVGVSFGTLSESAQTLTINLNAPDDDPDAPGDWYIKQSAPRNDSGSGELIWQPSGGINTTAKTHTYTLTGIVPEDGYAVGFNGKLTILAPGEGVPPDFDAAVADLDLDLPGVADSVEDQEPYGGLFLPVLYEDAGFPATANEACVDLPIVVRLKWAGPPSYPTSLGTLSFDLQGIGKEGVAIYKPDGARLTQSVSIAPGDLDGNKTYSATYKVLTNNDFQGIVTIEATFTWDASLASRSGDATTARDRVRLLRTYELPECYVDLDTDSDNSAFLERDDAEEEIEYESPGKYITYLEGSTRVEVALDVLPTGYLEGVTGRLWLPEDQAGLRVWTSPSGDEEVELDAEWDLSQELAPTRLWVEVSRAGESHLRFALFDAAQNLLCGQTVIFTGVGDAAQETGWDTWCEVKFPKNRPGGGR